MNKKAPVNKEQRVFVFCLITAFVLLAICSKSSFLYPINDWEDANIFFTAGKSIAHGKVMYRDVYDHKGPVLYFLHTLAYGISKDTFLGVFCIEVAAFTAFLFAVYKILRLYVEDENLWILPLLGVLILSSKSFCHGDSAEELCLPLVTWSLYASLRYFKGKYPENMPYVELFLHGVLAGLIMLIKFTLLGFHFGWMLMIFLSCVMKGQYKRGLVSGMVFVTGMLVTTIPFFLYFGHHQALDSWYIGYIYNNIFGYSNADDISLFSQAKGMVKMLLTAFLDNWQFSVFIVLGVMWMAWKRGISRIQKCNIWLMCICTALGISWGIVYMHPYYPFFLSVFSCLGWIPILTWIDKCKKEFFEYTKIKSWLPGISLAISMCVAFLSGNYTEELGRSKEDVVQYQFRDVIMETEDPSLLNFGFMDGGFYTVCDIVPVGKYFTKTNMPGNSWIDEQLTLVSYGMVDYVVTRNHELPREYSNYKLVATGANTYEGNGYTYYLYRNRDLVK